MRGLKGVGVSFSLPPPISLCRVNPCVPLPCQVFGLQMVEIDTKHHIYILTSTLPRVEGENLKQ